MRTARPLYHCTLALLLALCACCVCASDPPDAAAASAAAAGDDAGAGGQQRQKRCSSLCSVCQSLYQTQVRRLCSARVLSHCDCEQFASENWQSANTSHCAAATPAAAPGFCPKGHQLDDVTGCPVGNCSPPSGCDRKWRQRCPSGTWCPLGHVTDANGCPTCDCACEDTEKATAACAAACAKLAASHSLLPATSGCPRCLCLTASGSSSSSSSSSSDSSSSDSPLSRRCVLKCPNSCGGRGHRNATADRHGCIADCRCRCPQRSAAACPADCPSVWRTDEHGCEVCECARPEEWTTCPPQASGCHGSACGPHGFRASASGCRLPNCTCACPPARCPPDCPGRLAWSVDAYGCAVCSCACPQLRCSVDCGRLGRRLDENGCPTCSCNCPAPANDCASGQCAVWAKDQFGCSVCSECRQPRPCVTMETGSVKRLCPDSCRGPMRLVADANGCLSCSCDTKCPEEPRCLLGCGPHARKRDAAGCVTSCDCDCPRVTRAACAANCSFSASVVKDNFGCDRCKCNEAPRCPLRFRCLNDCGSYGYEADKHGCQVSCRCNCPERRCSCGFGRNAKVDEFGCEVCDCKSLAEFIDEFF